MNESGFYNSVAQALTGCQLVEQELKLYITEAFDLVRKRLGDRIPFKMAGTDHEDAPLGRLIMTFSKLTDNLQLVKDLDEFKALRNYLSHKGIAHCLDPEDELMDDAMQEFSTKLFKIQADALRLRSMIHEEANKFRGYLWFEDISEDLSLGTQPVPSTRA